jgi:hypothetical protein
MLSFRDYLLLLEDRIDFLKNQYKDRLNTNHDALAQHHDSDAVIDHFSQHADPSGTKQHTDWILKQYQKGKIRQEDHPRIHTALSNFEKYKPRLLRKDINQYRSLNDLEDSVQPHLGKASSGKDQKALDKSDAEKLHDENGFKVYHLKSRNAACHYGKGTKWCTAAENNNMFDHYNSDGPVYYIEGKDNNGEKKKFQFHFESNQFMNDKDEEINLGEFIRNNPEVRNVKEFKDKHFALKDISKSELHHMIATMPSIGDDFLKHPNIDSRHLQNIIKRGHPPWSIFNHPQLTKDQLMGLYHSDPEQHNHTLSHKLFDTDVLQNVYNKDPSNYYNISGISMNPNIPEDIKRGIMKSHPNVIAGANNPTLNSDDIHDLLNDSNTSIESIVNLSYHPNFNHSHVQRFIDGKHDPNDFYPDDYATILKKASKEQVDDIIDNKPHLINYLSDKKLSKDQYHKIIDKYHNKHSIIEALLFSPHLDGTHLDKIIDHGELIRPVLQHNNITPQHVMKIIDNTPKSTNDDVPWHYDMPTHTKLPEVFDKLIKNENINPNVKRQIIKREPNVSRDTLLDVISDPELAGEVMNKTDKLEKEHYRKYFDLHHKKIGYNGLNIVADYVHKHPETAKEQLHLNPHLDTELIAKGHLSNDELYNYINSEHKLDDDGPDPKIHAVHALHDPEKLKALSNNHPDEKIRAVANHFSKFYEENN